MEPTIAKTRQGRRYKDGNNEDEPPVGDDSTKDDAPVTPETYPKFLWDLHRHAESIGLTIHFSDNFDGTSKELLAPFTTWDGSRQMDRQPEYMKSIMVA